MKELAECTILVVDDTKANLDILVDALGEFYDISVATDGYSALEVVEQSTPNLILLDIMMPGMDGYEVCRRLKSEPRWASIPVIFLTAMTEISSKTRGFELGAVDYITKPFEVLEIQARVKTHLSLLLARQRLERQNELLDTKVRERTLELALTQEVTIESMAVLAEYRDPETGGHIYRTQNYIRILAEKLRRFPEYQTQLADHYIDLLYKSAPLHDIGKVGVPDHILLKPGKLSDIEFDEMKRHTILGYEAIKIPAKKLGANSFLNLAMEIAYTHHEKWDKTGYPRGLKEAEIPLSGRLMALVDVYDALISKRVYKEPMKHSQAVSIILKGRGTHFEPLIVDAFQGITEEFRRIALEYADFSEERDALRL